MLKMKIKRPLSLDDASFRYGILIAAEVASDYDKYSSHPYLVSECILGKLNVLKGRPRKNAGLVPAKKKRKVHVHKWSRWARYMSGDRVRHCEAGSCETMQIIKSGEKKPS